MSSWGEFQPILFILPPLSSANPLFCPLPFPVQLLPSWAAACEGLMARELQPGQLLQEASASQELVWVWCWAQGAHFLDRGSKGRPVWRPRGETVRMGLPWWIRIHLHLLLPHRHHYGLHARSREGPVPVSSPLPPQCPHPAGADV